MAYSWLNLQLATLKMNDQNPSGGTVTAKNVVSNSTLAENVAAINGLFWITSVGAVTNSTMLNAEATREIKQIVVENG